MSLLDFWICKHHARDFQFGEDVTKGMTCNAAAASAEGPRRDSGAERRAASTRQPPSARVVRDPDRQSGVPQKPIPSN
jgi:hypothetical protein